MLLRPDNMMDEERGEYCRALFDACGLVHQYFLPALPVCDQLLTLLEHYSDTRSDMLRKHHELMAIKLAELTKPNINTP